MDETAHTGFRDRRGGVSDRGDLQGFRKSRCGCGEVGGEVGPLATRYRASNRTARTARTAPRRSTAQPSLRWR